MTCLPKTFQLFILAVINILLTACGDLFFREPQPTNEKELYRFPKKLWGNYISKDNASLLTIDPSSIVRYSDYHYIASSWMLDSGTVFISDSIVQFPTGEQFPFVKTGDSLDIHCSLRDTLFCLVGSNHIRKFKGYYFLNREERPGMWTVIKTSLKRGVFHFHYINNEKEIDLLEEITESPFDSNGVVMNVSRKQFRQFVRSTQILDGEAFQRIKKYPFPGGK